MDEMNHDWKVKLAVAWLGLVAVGVVAGAVWVILEEPCIMAIIAGIAVAFIGTLVAVCVLDDQPYERRMR